MHDFRLNRGNAFNWVGLSPIAEPRTAGRHQLISRPAASLLALSSAAFVAAAAMINRATLLLPPVAPDHFFIR
jgi:hypothetical protein